MEQEMNNSIILRDKEIAQKMRYENYEQFKTLVRMHLSFELDLNTDEFDLPCHEVIYMEKGKIKKWNRLSKKSKGCAPVKGNSPPELCFLNLSIDFITRLRKLKDFLLKEENIIQEGIFRRTGAVSRQNELKSIINLMKPFNVDENYTVHDCATVYKGYLSDLPEPLLTDAHYPAHCQIADLCNGQDKNRENHLLNSVQLLLLLLPEENRILLEDIIEMLHITIKYEKQNKMSSDSLATLFAPHLICPRNLPPEALHYVSQNMSSVISYMIVKGKIIFDIPGKLATDIRAYVLDQKRKKTMSPEQILDESISDISTVNTVYTFVDREKTAEAHTSNPTDTALAQLYAHIQSLPESSKKRKLIKQFNKENGQGTPLQFLMLNRKNASTMRSAKSFGDSIKKHIFHKTIMSRTPKRTNIPANFDTPNSVTSNTKLRVLFQSPISNISSNIDPCSSSSPSSINKSNLLQKSISSSSLLTISTTPKPSTSTSSSAPVSRQNSGDLKNTTSTNEINPLTPYRILCETVTQLGKTTTNSIKKSVEFLANNIFENDIENYTKTSLKNSRKESIIRYKSEPNLSRILCDKNEYNDDREDNNRKIEETLSLKNTLIKGVSMGNLKFTPDSVRPIKKLNSSLKRRTSIRARKNLLSYKENMSFISPQIIDNEINTPRNLNLLRNKDFITSTPSLLLGRRSMSPITKSTQKMPKSMQESIMTPRSRKPVMLTTTISEQNQTGYQSDLLSFREQDEDSFLSNNISTNIPSTSLKFYNNQSETENDKNHLVINENQFINKYENQQIFNFPTNSLSNNFREYLLTRSVLTTSPIDSSFSSQSDDFDSTSDLRDIDETELSESLLYCLDGNQPNDNEIIISENTNSPINRKRSAINSKIDNDDDDDSKENVLNNFNNVKKFLVATENPNETSL